jgi:hypothetical protein
MPVEGMAQFFDPFCRIKHPFMKKIKALAIFNALSLMVHLAITYFVMTKSINQFTVSEVSARNETLVTPAGFVFSIWGIIYIMSGLFCLYHIITAYKHDKTHPANNRLLKINGLFIILNLASAAWLIAWTNERLLAALALIGLQLVCLLSINLRLKIYEPLRSAEFKLVTQVTFSIYFGWISVAFIANTASWLTAIGWDGWGLTPIHWTLIMISILIVLSLLMLFVRRNIYFALVVAWALFGIVQKRNAVDLNNEEPIITAGLAGIGLLLICSVIQLIRNLGRKKRPKLFPSATTPLK